MGTLFTILFTTIVNGITMAPLMRILKLTDQPDERKHMLNNAYRELETQTEIEIERLRELDVRDSKHTRGASAVRGEQFFP